MQAENILKHSNLKNTGCRLFIIDQLLKCNSALTEAQLKDLLSSDLFDRVTFYRSLKTLEEKGIIHRIVLQDATIKYAINQDLNKKNHIHYHCKCCDKVICGTTNIPDDLYRSENFSVQEADVVLEGVCKNCSQKN